MTKLQSNMTVNNDVLLFFRNIGNYMNVVMTVKLCIHIRPDYDFQIIEIEIENHTTIVLLSIPFLALAAVYLCRTPIKVVNTGF